MKLIENPKKEQWSDILRRPTKTVDDIESMVSTIFNDVKANGDKAVGQYTLKFDKVELDTLKVSEAEIIEASNNVSKELKDAIRLAKSNVETFHSAQKTEKLRVETVPGVECWQEKRPIQKVGLYITVRFCFVAGDKICFANLNRITTFLTLAAVRAE